MISKNTKFINKAHKIHKNKYSYENIVYVDAKSKVTIACPIHGDFQQLPSNHLNGSGCPKCVMKSTKQVIQDFIKVHGDKYNYSKVDYRGAKVKVIITCPIHGDFEQASTNHLQGQNCPHCAKSIMVKKKTKNKKELLKEFKLIHKDKYDYSKVNYTGSHKDILITCPEHGDFEQTPANHLTGSGCSKCAKNGFNPSKSAYLYYLKVTTDNGKVLYKIGITNRTVNERFNLNELSKIEIIKQKLYQNGQDAYDEEQRILKQYNAYRYTGPDVLVNGNTELFVINVSEFL